jgi:hypothetical protein
MLLHAKIPHEEFNAALRNGSAEKKIKQILEEIKAEAVFFTEYDGRRGAIMIININDPSEVPKFAEPWFLSFKADVQFHIAMTPEELGRAGVEKLAKKWP